MDVCWVGLDEIWFLGCQIYTNGICFRAHLATINVNMYLYPWFKMTATQNQ